MGEPMSPDVRSASNRCPGFTFSGNNAVPSYSHGGMKGSDGEEADHAGSGDAVRKQRRCVTIMHRGNTPKSKSLKIRVDRK